MSKLHWTEVQVDYMSVVAVVARVQKELYQLWKPWVH